MSEFQIVGTYLLGIKKEMKSLPKSVQKLEDLELSAVAASSKKLHKRCKPNVSAVKSRLDDFNVLKRELS